MLAEVQLPTQDSDTEANGYDEEKNEVGGYGAAAGKVQVGGFVLISHSTITSAIPKERVPRYRCMACCRWCSKSTMRAR